MAEMHEFCLLPGDAHIGNFPVVVKPEATFGMEFIVSDMEHWTNLYRTPSPVQAATTMVPLMSAFSADQWSGFRKGYIAKREGTAGQRVIDLIEKGDLTGWIEARDAKRTQEAALLLTKLISEDSAMPDLDRAELLATLGTLNSEIGDPSAAKSAYRRALKVLTTMGAKCEDHAIWYGDLELDDEEKGRLLGAFGKVYSWNMLHPDDQVQISEV
jgi:hypothetical protein